MKYDEFKKAVDRIIEDEDTLMIHVSPDFQCDQTLGFPTSLCVCWEQGKAWLAPNDFMMSDLPDDQAQDVLNACAEYGIRNCEDRRTSIIFSADSVRIRWTTHGSPMMRKEWCCHDRVPLVPRWALHRRDRDNPGAVLPADQPHQRIRSRASKAPLTTE